MRTALLDIWKTQGQTFANQEGPRWSPTCPAYQACSNANNGGRLSALAVQSKPPNSHGGRPRCGVVIERHGCSSRGSRGARGASDAAAAGCLGARLPAAALLWPRQVPGFAVAFKTELRGRGMAACCPVGSPRGCTHGAHVRAPVGPWRQPAAPPACTPSRVAGPSAPPTPMQ